MTSPVQDTKVDQHVERQTPPENISGMDLSPIYLSEFRYETRTIRFTPPRYLQPHLDESEQLMVLECRELGIDIYASTREELIQALHEEIEMLWCEYAMEDDDVLAPDARELKASLRRNMTEERVAAG